MYLQKKKDVSLLAVTMSLLIVLIRIILGRPVFYQNLVIVIFQKYNLVALLQPPG